MATKSIRSGDRMLTATDVKAITLLQASEAKELLAEKLGIPPYNDPKDQQKAPFISYIYDNIVFATEKGFPWDHICLVVKFAHEFLKKILVENHQLADAIQDFKKKSDILQPLSDRHKKQYADFVYETVLCHYNLYKYVFSHLRDVIGPKVQKEIVVPPNPPPLSEGEDIVIWQYKQQVSNVEKKANEAMGKQRKTMEGISQNITGHKTLDNLNEVPLPYSKLTLDELVKDVLKGYTEKKEAELKVQAEGVVQDLEFKFQTTSVARPAFMGEPPRFKPKSPIITQKPSTNNNALRPEKEKRSARSARSKSGRSTSSSVSKK